MARNAIPDQPVAENKNSSTSGNASGKGGGLPIGPLIKLVGGLIGGGGGASGGGGAQGGGSGNIVYQPQFGGQQQQFGGQQFGGQQMQGNPYGDPNAPFQQRFAQMLSMLLQNRAQGYGPMQQMQMPGQARGGGGGRSAYGGKGGGMGHNAQPQGQQFMGNPMQALMSSRYGMSGTPFPFGVSSAFAGGTPGQYGLTPAFVQLMNDLRARRSAQSMPPQGGSGYGQNTSGEKKRA